MTETSPRPSERLFTYDFAALALAASFGFCNIAVFYGFAAYLERLGLDPVWRGPLLAAEPLAAFCLRPFLSVLLAPRGALALARLSMAGLGASLFCYQFARGVGPILAVRLLHGLSFVCLVSAVMTLLALLIPRQSAGRAFSYFSLATLAPYAIMPPLIEWLLPRLGGEDMAYAACSLLALPGLALLAPLGKRLGRRAMTEVPGAERPSLAELRRNLALPPVTLILAASLCVFLGTTLIFFYMKPFAMAVGLREPGLFFTVSTVASIAVRLAAGQFYDRLPKEAALVAALAGLTACMLGFASAPGEARFLALAAAYGASLGVVMPLLNAVMFGHSPPRLRGTNMNLMLFMMDAGYVAGPLAGGAWLASGAGYPGLFVVCAGCAALAGLLLLPLAVEGWRRFGREGA